MSRLLDLALTAAALIAVVPAALLVAELLTALGRLRPTAAPQDPIPETVILMPAHNETAVIGSTIEKLQSQLSDSVRLLVVADNCTDDTAALARAAGAEVIERDNAAARGKGFALDFGIRHLAARPPAVVIVLDADCDISPGGIHRLAAAAVSSGRPIQAQYLLHPHPAAGLGQGIATFAFRLKNYSRLLGLMRLGAPSVLTGSGMAFPWASIANVRLGSANLVEDMKLGIDLARAGTPPRFLPEVLISSPFPRTDEARQAQQQRWEHGHLAHIRSEAMPLLVHGLRTKDWRIVLLAIDAMIPPLTLLIALMAAGLVGALALAVLDIAQGPLHVLGWKLCAVLGSIGLTWVVHGRKDMSPAALATAPRFALAKLKVYSDYLLGRRSRWVRTDRS